MFSGVHVLVQGAMALDVISYAEDRHLPRSFLRGGPSAVLGVRTLPRGDAAESHEIF